MIRRKFNLTPRRPSYHGSGWRSLGGSKEFAKIQELNNNLDAQMGAVASSLSSLSDVDQYYQSYCGEREALDQALSSIRAEKARKEDERAKASKMLEEATDACRNLGIQEMQLECNRQELDRFHEQALCFLAAKRRDASGDKSEKCTACGKDVDPALEGTLALLQCHRGHLACPDCRMASLSCSECGLQLCYRFESRKIYLKPLVPPPVYVQMLPSPMILPTISPTAAVAALSSFAAQAVPPPTLAPPPPPPAAAHHSQQFMYLAPQNAQHSVTAAGTAAAPFAGGSNHFVMGLPGTFGADQNQVMSEYSLF